MGPFSFTILNNQPNLVYGISSVDDGNMSFRYGPYEEVRANRRNFFERLSVPEENVAVAQLEHGQTIIDVTEKDQGRGIIKPEESLIGDVLVTAKPNTFLFMVVADCMALLFFDPVKRVCALAHVGWKGVDLEVPRLTVEHLAKHYDSKPRDIVIGISPSLSVESACFPQVDQNNLPKWENYVLSKNGSYCIDSRRFATDQLSAAGIPKTNIELSEIDTRSDHRFFSHRRSVEDNLPEARFGVLIGICK